MRSILLAATALCLSAIVHAQLKIPLKSNSHAGLRNDLQKVVESFPHQFQEIRGVVVAKNPQTVEYASLVNPAGSRETMIVKYSTDLKPVYSWQTVLLTTEDYEDAAKKYKAVYNQLKGMNVKYIVDNYTLRGEYEAPDESRGFATSILTPAHPPAALKKLKVEVSMQFEFPEWKVSVMVYEKEKEDDEQYMDDAK
ncbi:MAG TPA: hypothetical protein VD794_03525 [Flavisolibacter sp.]|nr:hypothetical protein [Flavisolibacter sp.]